MPGDFQLRPYDECETLDNYFHEQGARALAAAIEARIMECRSMCYCNGRGLPCSRCGGLGEASGIIHRLVPPGAGKEKA